MEREEPEWKYDLKRDLKAITDRYTSDRYIATEETQQTYQYDLGQLETAYQDRLDIEERAERRGFDAAYRMKELSRLNVQERAAWTHATTSSDLWAIRESQRSAREDVSSGKQNPAYRQTEEYRDGLQQLVTEQAYDRDSMDQAFRRAENVLDDRFGFSRNNGEQQIEVATMEQVPSTAHQQDRLEQLKQARSMRSTLTDREERDRDHLDRER